MGFKNLKRAFALLLITLDKKLLDSMFKLDPPSLHMRKIQGLVSAFWTFISYVKLRI